MYTYFLKDIKNFSEADHVFFMTNIFYMLKIEKNKNKFLKIAKILANFFYATYIIVV
jgi:hypothetical protein